MNGNYRCWVVPRNNSYLAHSGIKGQKWGIRRYENEDGTLTPEGKERYYGRYDYSTTNGYRSRKSFSDVMFKKDEETGKRGLSKTGKALIIGAGITSGALLTGIGAGILIHKAGGTKVVNNWIRDAIHLSKISDNNVLRKLIEESRTGVVEEVFNRSHIGGNVRVGQKRNIPKLVKSAIACTVFNTEYSKRATISAIYHLMGTPQRFNDFVGDDAKAVKTVDNIVQGNATKTISGVLSVGTAAIVGSVAYELKQRADKEDPTGEKGRYIAPNPNKKK